MIGRVYSVAFQGVDVLEIDVQVQTSAGLPVFHIVGLGDKAVVESRERIRASFHTLGLSLPAKHITVNLAPADVQKEGTHFDLPVALGLMVVMGVLSSEDVSEYTALGELGLDGSLAPVSGILPAAIETAASGRGLICPAACGSEAAWAGDLHILAASSLIAIVNHFKGTQILSPPQPKLNNLSTKTLPDLYDIKGQETAKRAIEVAAAGGHNMLMVGPPGAGKSMLASRLPSILPPLEAQESLEVTMIHSISGTLPEEGLVRMRPFRDPHHSASLPAIIGGGIRCKPGEISLAHLGILFLDELPEFNRATLEALRQPLETGKAVVARANAHVTYPARVQVIAAMNPCRCGYFGDPLRECSRVPRCAQDYQNKISGPLLDRFDITIDVPEVTANDLLTNKCRETSIDVRERVCRARAIQHDRYTSLGIKMPNLINSIADGTILEQIATIETDAQSLLTIAMTKLKLSGRGYHRVLRVARTLADLENADVIKKHHIAEALSYRRSPIITHTP
jgi:magnesium chelatase family protein